MDRSGYAGAVHISNELIRREGKLKNGISAKMIIDNKTVGESITVKQCDRCQLPIPFLLITQRRGEMDRHHLIHLLPET